MIPSLLPPMSMMTLSRCTATTVPRTISPSLPKSPALMLASNRAAKFSAGVAACSVVFPGEVRAVVLVDMWLGKSSAVRRAGDPRPPALGLFPTSLAEVGPPSAPDPSARNSLLDPFCQRRSSTSGDSPTPNRNDQTRPRRVHGRRAHPRVVLLVCLVRLVSLACLACREKRGQGFAHGCFGRRDRLVTVVSERRAKHATLAIFP